MDTGLKFQVGKILRSVTGGSLPSIGDSLIFSNNGWVFKPATDSRWLSVVDSDPVDPSDGQMWYNATDNRLRVKTVGGVFESSAFTLMP